MGFGDTWKSQPYLLSFPFSVSQVKGALLLLLFKVFLLKKYFIPLIAIYFYFLALLPDMWDLSSPTRDRTHAPLHWKCGILTTGPPGMSQGKIY